MPRIASDAPASVVEGLDYKASVDSHTGGGGIEIPIRLSPGRSGGGPDLALAYTSGSGNSMVGAGWSLVGLPFIALDTREGVPRYEGADPVAYRGRTAILPELQDGTADPRIEEATAHRVHVYRSRYGYSPRRYERWVHRTTGDVHWRMRDRENVVTIFGRSPSHRIADPADSARIFRWLVESVHDSTGNAVLFEYQAEDERGLDPALIYEAARIRQGAFAQRYPKRIRYGNAAPLGPDEPLPADLTWHFEAVFDYGDHGDEPHSGPDRPWPVRSDPFSTGRAGFELRTYRLLRRVLMFHQFERLGPDPVCVGATRLTHAEDPAGATLVSVDYEGRRQDGETLATRTLPSLTLTYSRPAVGAGFEPLDSETVENVPAGLSGRYRLTDLYGEGLPGILSESGGDWFYKPNLGGGRFGPQERVGEAPSLRGGPYALGDFDRDGNPNLGRLLGREAGFFEYDRNARRWHSFTPFASAPHVAVDASVQWVDLNADGLPDLVVPHPDHFTWYPSLGREGFGGPVDIPIPHVRGDAPPLIAEDVALRFFFADMTGDGRPDLVHVDSGRVEYWSHLGLGRFGEGVVMADAPAFDHEGTFDPRRIRLTDIDGSGTADLLYLGRGEVRFWGNAAGNRFVAEQRRAVPYIDDLAAVQVLDLLGDGTPCLAWSSALPGDAATPLRHLPLTDGVTPRLLLSIDNGMGRETRFAYNTSAAHYLRDREGGRGWRTHLPSHVTVVDEKEEIDHVGGGRLVSRYEYHDGHFDGHERTFRGFGLVDQYDAEDHPGPGALPEHYTAPTCLRTWFHDGTSGPALPHDEDGWEDDPLHERLSPPALEAPAQVGADEYEDAYRALAGLVLRQEVFATDEVERAPHPFQIAQNTYRVRRLQPATAARPAAFAAYRTERLDYDYGEQPDDPRVAHHLTLEVDAYGFIRTEAHVAYPRRQAGPPGTEAQQDLHAAATRTTLAHVDTLDRHLVGIAVETEEFELVALSAEGASGLVRREGLQAALPAALAAPLDVHEPDGAGLQARRREWERCFYWNDARTEVLPLGQAGTPLLVHHEETACFTDPLVQDVYGAHVNAGMLAGEGGYTPADGYWWQPGPTYRHRGHEVFYSLEEEVAPVGGATRFTFDEAVLNHAEVRDALGNTTRIETDYQALAPARVTDSNDTVTETRYDPLGVAVLATTHGTARAADGAEHPYGSAPLDDYADPPPAEFSQVLADPAAYLQQTDRYLFYDVHAWTRDGTPPHAVSLAREALVHDGEGGGTANGPVQVVVSYADGFGRALQQKQRVEAGPAVQRGADGRVVLDAGGAPILAETDERWLVSGHTVYTNKQQPVRQYEPFFSPAPDFEADGELRRYGVASEHHYDALGQRVRTDLPNGTFTRSERTPWLERHFDTNDTVADSAYRLAREILPPGDPERQALDGAHAHADTPTTAHFDALGREILVVETGDGGTEHPTRQRYDGAGHLAEVTDPRGLSAFTYRHDMLGRTLYERSADAGERWTLPNLYGDAVHTWDARGVHLATSYDLLGRPTSLRADGALGLDQVVERWTYGEALAGAEAQARNARGRLVEHRDGAGVLALYDLTPGGAPLRHSRRFRVDYKAEVDWSDPAAVALDADTFETQTHYDALGRAVRLLAPDGSIRRFAYLAGGALHRVLLTTAGGELVEAPILQSAQYNARGQRTRAVLGNDVQLDVDYDADTFRMERLRARRFEGDEVRLYQDLAYTYDPVGNVVRVADAAQQPDRPSPHVLQGLNVSADAAFTYDAFYRLTAATGRVHQALLQHDYRRDLPDPDALKGTRHLSLNNGAAVERYTRTYRYDASGNLEEMMHVGATQRWTTRYWVSPTSNRSLLSEDADGIPITHPESYFDAAGHCVRLPHLRALDWNSRGCLARAVIIDRNAAGESDDAEYYVYDGGGQRRRKVTEKLASGQVEITEKLYLDGCEIKRIRHGATLLLERHTAHVGDGVSRLALVHRWLRDDLGRETDAPGSVRVHYQLQNHLGSAALELDASGGVITYEEFFPYGGSAFIAGDDLRDVRIKDYRYGGKECGDETGLYYYGYRYYAPFIGNWLSPDPLGPADGLNLYRFVRNNPVTLTDPNGLQSTEVEPGQIRHYEIEALPSQFQSVFDNLTPEERIEWANRNLFFTTDEQGQVVKMSRAEAEVYARERAQEGLDTDVGWVGGSEEEQLDVTITEYEVDGETVQHYEFHEGITFGGEDDFDLGRGGAGAEGAVGNDGPRPDPADPNADESGNAVDDDPNAQGRGQQGYGRGGGGEDPNGRGTGEKGHGRGVRGSGQRSNGLGRAGWAPGGTRGGKGQRTGGRHGGRSGADGMAPPGDVPPDTNAPRGYDSDGSPAGVPGPPPNGYRPPPPGTLPGGTDPFGDSQGAPDGASGQGGEPGSGQGGNGQGDEQGGGTPPQRERDALDTLVDIASYVTLDAFFGGDEEGEGDPNGIPGGMGLFDLNIGRWGQVAYVGLALADLVMTVLTLGETKAMMVGAKVALRRGMSQLRRLAPLARQAIKEAGQAVPRVLNKVKAAIRRMRAGLPFDDPLLDNNILTWIAEGRTEALAFANRYRNLMSIDRTVAREFMRGGRSAHQLWDLMQQHGIRLVQTASRAEADAVRLARAGGVVVPDDFIVATARRLGIRFATGDRRALRAAIHSGVDVRYFNFGPGNVVHRYGRVVRSLRDLQNRGVINSVRDFLGPFNPW